VTADDASEWSEDLAFAHELARIAAPIALELFGSAASYLKADGTPVGEADLAVDKVLSEMIRATFPNDAILSEESPPSGSSARRWILDPIDGTVPFLEGRDEWGTHVALEEAGEIVLGVVTRPARGEIYWAIRGGGAWHGTTNGHIVTADRRLRASTIDDLDNSRVSVWPLERRPDLVAQIKANARWVEPDYGIALGIVEGTMEAVFAFDGGPWDHAPIGVLVEEAGGQFRDPEGGRRLDLRGGFFTNGRRAWAP
jgi:histidinol-phosphatase